MNALRAGLCLAAILPGVGDGPVAGHAGTVDPLASCPQDARPTRLGGQEACVLEVRFDNDSLTLAGQWFTPPDEEKYPAVVIARGSGPSRRDNAWTLSFVSLLVESGYGVLLPDKRGSGESGGDWREADFEDLAGDLLAGVRFARSRPAVRGGAVGVLGLSQGGEVVPIAAAKSNDVDFVVNVVGAAVPFIENVTFEMRHTFREEGLEGRRMRVAMDMVEAAIRYLRGDMSWTEYARELDGTRSVLGERLTGSYFIADSTHWRWDFFRRLRGFDPVDWWRRVEQPALVLYGGADSNTPSERSAARLRRAFAETGHPASRVEMFPGLGHALWDTAGPMHEHRLHPDVRGVLLNWLQRVRSEVSGGGSPADGPRGKLFSSPDATGCLRAPGWRRDSLVPLESSP